MKKVINLEICSKCFGTCCKKSGCDYMPNDFDDLSFEGLFNAINKRNISIVSELIFREENDSFSATPILFLREKGIGKNTIDLVSMKNACSSLTSTGCKYTLKDRPSGGSCIIPSENYPACPTTLNKQELLSSWIPYQEVLTQIVKKITGMSVEDRIKNDVKQLIIKYLSKEYDTIHPSTVKETLQLITNISKAYPKETKQAAETFKNMQKIKSIRF